MKKALSLLLTLAMILSTLGCLTVVASAEETHSHDGMTAISTATDLALLFRNGGRGYLANDLTADKASYMVFSDDQLELCLNDHILNMNGSSITVSGTLILDDCGTTTRYFSQMSDKEWVENEVETVYPMTGGYIYSLYGSNYGISVESTGKFIMNEGCIFNTQGSSTMSIRGGEFVMNGGEIFKNIMNNSSVIGTTGNSKITINGGTVEGNKSGTALFSLNDTQMVINGGKFIDNDISNYGFFYVNGTSTLTINDGYFSTIGGNYTTIIREYKIDNPEQIVVNNGTFDLSKYSTIMRVSTATVKDATVIRKDGITEQQSDLNIIDNVVLCGSFSGSIDLHYSDSYITVADGFSGNIEVRKDDEGTITANDASAYINNFSIKNIKKVLGTDADGKLVFADRTAAQPTAANNYTFEINTAISGSSDEVGVEYQWYKMEGSWHDLVFEGKDADAATFDDDAYDAETNSITSDIGLFVMIASPSLGDVFALDAEPGLTTLIMNFYPIFYDEPYRAFVETTPGHYEYVIGADDFNENGNCLAIYILDAGSEAIDGDGASCTKISNVKWYKVAGVAVEGATAAALDYENAADGKYCCIATLSVGDTEWTLTSDFVEKAHDCVAGETVKENEVAATCTADGTYDEVTYCTICNEELSREAKTVEATGHSFSNYVSNDDATCTSDGTKTAKCDNCDATDTVADEGTATGHSFTDYVSNGDATCTEDGTKTAKCDNCDATDTVADEGTATGHSFTDYVSNDDATCTADGTKTAKCDDCDATDTVADEGSAKGHDYVEQADGSQICSGCGDVIEAPAEENNCKICKLAESTTNPIMRLIYKILDLFFHNTSFTGC